MTNPSALLNGKTLCPMPAASASRLAPLAPALIAAALIDASGEAGDLESRLSELTGAQSPGALEALQAGGLALSAPGGLRLTEAGADFLRGMLGEAPFGAAAASPLKALAALALGLGPSGKAARRYLSRRENIETAALAKLFGLSGLSATPARSSLRFALAREILLARHPEFAAPLNAASPRNGRANSLVNALIIGLAGGVHTTIAEAETHMLMNALGAKTAGRADIASAIIRAAVQPRRERAPRAAAEPALDAFASEVRRIARKLETKPYAGRVAIAQVYDEGLAQGAEFGALETFKTRIAEACRAGHLDLERYDIAGPFDPHLKERSRTAFGRDERHFIVNQPV